MGKRIGALAAAALLAAAMAACGSSFQKVTVHRTGGIAGLDEIYSVRQDGIGRIEKIREAVTRTVKLDKDRLERIAAIAGRVPVEATPTAFKSERGADFFNYELTLERKDGDPVVYRWDDGVHPADARQESTLAALQDLSRAVIEEVKKAAER